MPTIIRKCPTCLKLKEETNRFNVGTITLITFSCGHSTSEQNIHSLLRSRFDSWKNDKHICNIGDGEDTKCPCFGSEVGFWFNDFGLDSSHVSKRSFHLRPHQIENLEHFITSSGKHQIQDETGLGKTASKLAELKLCPESLPHLILCKGSLTYQWQKEVFRTLGIVPQVIQTTKEQPNFKFFKIIICSLDKLKRVDWLEDEEVMSNFKGVTIDEIQNIKNADAKRTKAVQKACSTIPFITQLSGTPIENHAGEYYPSLNIIWPEKFHSKDHFQKAYVTTYWNGYTYKLGGLFNPKEFFNETRRVIIRHKSEDVEGMPSVSRDYKLVEIAASVQEAYEVAEDAFLEAFEQAEEGIGNAFQRQTNLAAKMQRLRHITGLAKVEASLEFISEFLENNDRKIGIYVHHDDVGMLLNEQLVRICKERNEPAPINLCGTGPEERAEKIVPFKNGKARIMLAKLLASGEGLDIPECSDYLIIERHWNRAKEIQVEGRGKRLSSKNKIIFVTYLIGFQTIDEFMSETNEQKHQYTTEALEGTAQVYTESDIMTKIGKALKVRGKKKWRMNV